MGELRLSGSWGDELWVYEPDADSSGETRFEIYSEHDDVTAIAMINAHDRRKLIEWLQANTPLRTSDGRA